MSWTKLLFSFEGQIDRPELWKGLGAIAVFAGAMYGLAIALGGEYGPHPYVWNFAMPIGWYMALAVGAKRCRDRGRPAWTVLLALAPFAGQLWYLIELGFLPHRTAPPLTAAQRAVHAEGPFLTRLGWICLGLFSLQAVVFSLLLANAMQVAARGVEAERARCERGDYGNQPCYISGYHGDVEAFRIMLTVGSLVSLAGLALSRKLAINPISKKA